MAGFESEGCAPCWTPVFVRDEMPGVEDGCWEYDSELCTVVFRRVGGGEEGSVVLTRTRSGSESWIEEESLVEDRSDKMVGESVTVPTGLSSLSMKRSGFGVDDSSESSSLADESTLVENVRSEKAKGSCCEDDDGDLSVLRGLRSVVDGEDEGADGDGEEDEEADGEGTGVVGTSGLGIYGLPSPDGTGVVGLSGGVPMKRSLARRERPFGLEDEDEDEDEEGGMAGVPSLSRIMIEELAAAFGSSPAGSRARSRGRRAGGRRRRLEEGEEVLFPVRGLGIARGLTPMMQRGVGRVGFSDGGVSRVLLDEVENTFGSGR